jgi:hypothetical protein
MHSARRARRQAEALAEIQRETQAQEDARRAQEKVRQQRRLRRQEQAERKERQRVWMLRAVVVFLALVPIAAGFLYVASLWRQRNHGTGQEELLAYVPGDSGIIAGVDLGAWSDTPEVIGRFVDGIERNLGHRNFLVTCRENTGLSPAELFDKATLAVGFGEEPTLTLVGRSSLPFDQYRIRDVAGSARTRKHRGMTYFAVDAVPFKWLFMPSDRTIVLTNAPEEGLRQMIGLQGAGTLLSTDVAAHIASVRQFPTWLVAPFKQGLAQQIGQKVLGSQVQPLEAWKAIGATLSRARSLRMWIMKGPIDLQVSVGLADEAAAEQFATAGLQLLNLDRGRFANRLQAAKVFEPNSPLLALAQLLLSRSDLTRDGAMVGAMSRTLRPGELYDLLEKVRVSLAP